MAKKEIARVKCRLAYGEMTKYKLQIRVQAKNRRQNCQNFSLQEAPFPRIRAGQTLLL